jgi:hypothetical protein
LFVGGRGGGGGAADRSAAFVCLFVGKKYSATTKGGCWFSRMSAEEELVLSLQRRVRYTSIHVEAEEEHWT